MTRTDGIARSTKWCAHAALVPQFLQSDADVDRATFADDDDDVFDRGDVEDAGVARDDDRLHDETRGTRGGGDRFSSALAWL